MNADSLFINQTELYETLTKFLTNIKKDGSERKTIDNYKRKNEMLEAYWREYQENHRKLCELAEFNHPYFTNGCFDVAQEVYIKIKEVIDKTMDQLGRKQIPGPASPRIPEKGAAHSLPQIHAEQLNVDQRRPGARAAQPPSGTSSRYEVSPQRENFSSSRESSKLDELVKKQGINFKAFIRTVSKLQVDKCENKWQFENALKLLDNRWNEIDKLHWIIEGENGDDDSTYQKEFTIHEETYYMLTESINQKMWSVKQNEKSTPQMTIPVFHGTYNHWVSFKDLFSEAIDKNPSMSNAQKMQFLKSKVAGEAERLIHHLQISSDNYKVCWEILNHRYGNKKLIFSSHITTLLSIPSMQQQSMTMIKKLHDVTKETLHAIQNLGVNIATWDPLLVHLLGQKLDSETFTEYIESVKNPRELPSLQEFMDFLEMKFTALEAARRKQEPTNQRPVMPQPSKPNQHNQKSKKHFQRPNYYQPSYKENFNSSTNACNVLRSMTCALCNAEHGLWQCSQFLQMTHEQKLKKVEEFNFCLNCLCSHSKKPCFSTKRCRKCLGVHNTLLHEALSTSTSAKPNVKTTNSVATKESASRSSHVSWDDMSEILLATAVVNVRGADGTQHRMRALVDQGSQLSLINENAAQRLGLKRINFKGQIFGVGEKENNSKGMIEITIESFFTGFTLNTNVVIMNNLIKRLPNSTFTIPSTWDHLQGISLADPEFNISRQVDLLLGADVYSKIMLGGILRGSKDDQPIAQQTQLGWLLCGSMKPQYHCNVILNNTEDLLKYWENEDINQKIEMSNSDHECLKYFLDTTKRLECGRYEVRLPFIPEIKDKLGATKPQALAQFRSLEKKLEKNQELKADYHKFMNEYLSLNHMIPSTSKQTPECYLPHHAVTRAESTTTKLRVVFNASAKSASGYSLNDIMYRGPNIQKDLQELILRWRQYQYAYTSDIEKMYRMIKINQDDQDYQKIIWRDSNQNIKAFKLVTLTYGTKPAGFLAMMCLRKLADDERQRFPGAAKELEECFYMDDYCGGHHTVQKANQLKADMIELLRLGGFNLRKWASNKPELLADLDKDQCNQSTYEFKQTDTTKTLGLGWNPQQDNFIFNSKIESESPAVATKRSLLSDISKLFDPLGWLTPLSTTMKILFQSVWLSKLQWDEKLPEKINSEWVTLRQELKFIHDIKINRWIDTEENQKIELHGFCDASNKAYACVIYCKTIKKDRTTIKLVAGKARLGPLSKSVSIPRLELMGAQLLTQLMQKVQNCLSDYHTDVYCWTDSMAVLGWIKGDPARWKPFVSNRVNIINKTIPANQWRYVSTNANPADCASRGLTVKQLKDHSLWWHGPSWLPSYINQKDETKYETTLETKKLFPRQSIAVVQSKNCATMFEDLLNKFSSITKIIHIVAWILRLPACRKRVHQPYLELQELRRAKMLIIKSVQRIEFANDMDSIIKHHKVHSKSRILNLNPTIDEHGVLRVGGRLRNAHIDLEMKHPIILPHDHRLTFLMIKQAHELTFHGGVRLTLANLRQQYWIIGGYMATKKFIRKCVTCRRHEPIKQYQLMGDLPAARVNPEKAFHHCGVDYTGFIEVKANKGRGIKTTKGYIAIFVCMVTKAVHIELVSDLTSSAFLAALHRLAARRGAPRHIYSDNGINFVGANRILQEEYNQLLQIFSEGFMIEMTEMGIEWHFNVPSWPNAGGLWERAVRSLKHHLKRIIGQQKLTFEEYTTLLTRLEACLNSRPLCALSEDPNDLDYLTPAHFLTGRPGTTIIETEQDARTRWHLTSKLFQDLWKRWKTEYLVQLSSRTKWMKPQKNLAIGDLVAIQDENLPPGKWALGRVIDTHPGDEGLTRAVTLKTKNGMIKRLIVKLSVLPVNQDNITTQKPPEPETKLPERRGRSKSNLATIATVLLGLMMLISPTYGLHEIKRFPNNQTLYFDPISKIQLIRDKWTLVVYYDMGPYWTGIGTYNKISNYLDRLCATIQKQSHCNTIVQQARHDYQELEYYNELLLTQHFDVHARRRRNVNQTERRRRRRGLINGIGYLANDLFGVLDSRFADQYAKDIETIHRNEKHLSKLWKNQTSVIEAEFNLMKKMENTIDKQHKLINKKLMELQDNASTLQREIQNISYIQDFTLTAMAGNTLLQSLRRLQDTLLDTITDIYHGQISMHLRTPTQLKRELQTINGQMPSELALPISNINNDFQYIYKLLKVKARATQRYMIIEVTFPLIGRESYQLYNLIPVPHQIDTTMITIIPVAEYVAVDLKKDAYFTITANELSACLHHRPAYMCQVLKPIRHIQNDESFCVLNTSTKKCKFIESVCTNKWLELHSSSQHLYFCCDNYTIKIICDERVMMHQLSQAGVIAMSQDCVIKGKDFSVYSIRHQSNQINITATIQVPEFDQINHLINIQFPDGKPTYYDESVNISMTSLEKAVKELKASDADVEDMSPHDIHHYVIGYVLLVGALVAIAVWACRNGRCRRRRGRAAEHRGEGRRRQESAATPPPPRPQRRRTERPRQESVPTPAAQRPTSETVQSEVIISASELSDKSDTSFRLKNYIERWPIADNSAGKRATDTKRNTGIPNEAFIIEDSEV